MCTDNNNSLADRVSRVLIDQTRGSMATLTLVYLTLVSFKSGWTHTFNMATAGQCAGPGVYTVVMADICQRES